MNKINLGYACINTELKKQNIFCSRSCTIKTLEKLGPKKAAEYCKSLALQNCRDLLTILKWNESHDIKLFRISSEIFPHVGNFLLHPDISKDPYFLGDINFAKTELKKAGDFAKTHGHRLTFHAQPYVNLGSPNSDVAKRSIFDLEIHGKIIRMLGCGDVIIVHGGGLYQGDLTVEEAKQKTLTRWYKNYAKLSKFTRERIVLENDEFIYGVSDLLPFCESKGIPFLLDFFHNAVNKDSVKITRELLKKIIKTWNGRIPKFHVSEQDPEKSIGSHSQMVKKLPPEVFWQSCDIMIEAKLKEQAVLYLRNRYF